MVVGCLLVGGVVPGFRLRDVGVVGGLVVDATPKAFTFMVWRDTLRVWVRPWG